MLHMRVVKYRLMQGGHSYRLRIVDYDFEDPNDVIFIHPEEVSPHSLIDRFELLEHAHEMFRVACSKPAIDYDLWCEAHDVNIPVVIDIDAPEYMYSFVNTLYEDDEEGEADRTAIKEVIRFLGVEGATPDEVEDMVDEAFIYLDDQYEISSENRWFGLVLENICMVMHVLKEIDENPNTTQMEKTDKVNNLLKHVRVYTLKVISK